MKEIVNFLFEINKLKEIPRTGWVLRKVENPETIADHSFSVATLAWLLAEEQPNLSIAKTIKMSISHDFCEVYAGDITPCFYYIRELPKDEEERKKFLSKYIRLPRNLKEERTREKENLEKESLLKLIKKLPEDLKKEIFSLWLEYTEKISSEGKFVKQVDKVETLLQAIEYFGTSPDSYSAGWWEEVEEFVTNPLLSDFLKTIQKKFYKNVSHYKKNKRLEGILDFILKILTLKKMPRRYWNLRKIKKPETISGHTFTVTTLSWLLGRKKSELNMRKLLKMALVHEIVAFKTGDLTPYDRVLKKKKGQEQEILNKMLRLTRREKKRIFKHDFKIEKKSLLAITKTLSKERKKEIIEMWEDYKEIKSPEGNFLSQVNIAAVLLQGISYKKTEKNLLLAPLWELAFESVHDPLILEFLETLKEKENSQ